jgi:excisionase family DNA binding protein
MTLKELVQLDAAAISVSEAASVLGCDRRTADKSCDAGHLPFIQIGRKRLIPRVALLRLLGIEVGEQDAF